MTAGAWKGGYLAAFAAAIGLSLSFDYLLDLLFHPWAYSLPGTVSAAGSWAAAIDVPRGARHRLFVELAHKVDHSHEGGNSPALEGFAYTCLAGAPKKFDDAIYSSVHGASWSGSRVRLELRSDLGIARLPGFLECSPSSGRLRCEAGFQFTRHDAASEEKLRQALRKRDYPAATAALRETIAVPIEFRRATLAEFQRACSGTR